MNTEVANVIMQFMQRVQLQGSEVPAWTRCIEELTTIVSSPTETTGVETNDEA